MILTLCQIKLSYTHMEYHVRIRCMYHVRLVGTRRTYIHFTPFWETQLRSWQTSIVSSTCINALIHVRCRYFDLFVRGKFALVSPYQLAAHFRPINLFGHSYIIHPFFMSEAPKYPFSLYSQHRIHRHNDLLWFYSINCPSESLQLYYRDFFVVVNAIAKKI